jgi:hypothetical protein
MVIQQYDNRQQTAEANGGLSEFKVLKNYETPDSANQPTVDLLHPFRSIRVYCINHRKRISSMKPLRLFVIGLMSIATSPLVAAPTDDFVTTWKTDNPGTSNSTSITVPMIGGPYDVDWDNDGFFDQFGITDAVTHDFGVAGTYTIRIFGSYESIRFDYRGDKEKIL